MVDSPSMEAKKKESRIYGRLFDSNKWQLGIHSMQLSTVLFEHSNPMGHTFRASNADEFKLQITTCAENGKNQLTPKITNHLFTCYLNSMYKSNPVCLIHQWLVIFSLASYVQWLSFFLSFNNIIFYFGHTKINPLTFPHLCSLWKGMQLNVSLYPMNE